MREARFKGLIEGIYVGIDKVKISKLQFANDTLVFLPKKESVIANYRRLLTYYEVMFGLRIKFGKSKLNSWDKNDE